jgi:galactokinase
MRVVARAPGRVNLIGDHTDYSGGLVLPIAIDLETVVSGRRKAGPIVVRSADGEVDRHVRAVADEMGTASGFVGEVATTLPIGGGLSSSAALEIALALAFGFDGTALELARLCQRAEQAATGVPCGIMDQLASAAGVAGHALLIDCASETVEPVLLPEGIEVVVVDSGQTRALAATAYAERRAQCEAAAEVIGPLREATLADVAAIGDGVLRRRARHVVTENDRVRAFAGALRAGRLDELGPMLSGSHASLRDDFEVSTPVVDGLVDRLARTPGVVGARLTGAGFGGSAIALVRTGETDALTRQVSRVFAERGFAEPLFYEFVPAAGAEVAC